MLKGKDEILQMAKAPTGKFKMKVFFIHSLYFTSIVNVPAFLRKQLNSGGGQV